MVHDLRVDGLQIRCGVEAKILDVTAAGWTCRRRCPDLALPAHR